MSRKQITKTMVAAHLDPALLSKLDRACKRERRTRASKIRMMVEAMNEADEK